MSVDATTHVFRAPLRARDRGAGAGAQHGVEHTFARGGRNFQRIRGEPVERQTAELWQEHRSG